MEKKKWTPQQIENWNKTKQKGIRTYQEKLKNKEVVYKPAVPNKINPRSKKRAAQERKYNKLVAELKKLPQNEICQWPGCDAPTMDCHHMYGREGDRLLDQSGFCFLCREHHRYAELNPEEAKEIGVSGLRIEKIK